MIDDDGLVFARRRARSIDNAHVCERDHRRIECQEGSVARLEPILREDRGGEGEYQGDPPVHE